MHMVLLPFKKCGILQNERQWKGKKRTLRIISFFFLLEKCRKDGMESSRGFHKKRQYLQVIRKILQKSSKVRIKCKFLPLEGQRERKGRAGSEFTRLYNKLMRLHVFRIPREGRKERKGKRNKKKQILWGTVGIHELFKPSRPKTITRNEENIHGSVL